MLNEIDFNLIERTANECGIPAFQFLRGVAKIVKGAPAQNPSPSAEAAHEAVDTHGIDEKAQGFVLGLELGRRITAFELANKVLGSVPVGRGARRSWTYRVAKLDGLAPVMEPDKERGERVMRRETNWGPSNLFERVPLVTDQRSAG